MDLKSLTDALGQPFEFGNLYGFSTNHAGVTRVVVGNAIKATPKGKVTLKVRSVKQYHYVGHNGEDDETEWNPLATVLPNMCFPVTELPPKPATQEVEGLSEMGRS